MFLNVEALSIYIQYIQCGNTEGINQFLISTLTLLSNSYPPGKAGMRNPTTHLQGDWHCLACFHCGILYVEYWFLSVGQSSMDNSFMQYATFRLLEMSNSSHVYPFVCFFTVNNILFDR